VFWGLTEGAVAAALLWVGGTNALTALQTASIATALPFSIVMVLMVFATLKALKTTYREDVAPKSSGAKSAESAQVSAGSANGEGALAGRQ
jgi:choline-glycine betaine transporter